MPKRPRDCPRKFVRAVSGEIEAEPGPERYVRGVLKGRPDGRRRTAQTGRTDTSGVRPSVLEIVLKIVLENSARTA